MSLVLGYANKENAIIMSDGRAGENGSYSECYDKTLKVNDNIIMGYVGIMENIDMFLSCALSNMGENRKYYFIDNFLDMVDYIMQDEETKKLLQSDFIIIGQDSKGNMIASTVGQSTNYKVKKGIAYEPKFLSVGGTINRKVISEICFSHMGEMKISPISAMREIIKDVSRVDSAVNGNVFYSSLAF